MSCIKNARMKKYYYFVLLIIISTSCISDVTKRELTADTSIYIDRDKIKTEVMKKASIYVEDVQYIPLETNNENLIGDVTKVILSSNFIHIYDYLSDNIYQFDYNGKYIRKIGSRGNGPNEYMRITSFSVNQDTEDIAIYCEIKQSIIEFTSDGQIISENKLGFLCNDLIHYEDGFMLYGGRLPNEYIFNETFPKQKRLIKIDSEYEIVETYLPTVYNAELLQTTITSERNCLYYTTDNQLRLLEKPNGLVYDVNENMEPVYIVDFYKYTIPLSFFYDQIISKKEIQSLKNGDYCYLSSFYETDDYIYLSYVVNSYDRMISQCFYVKGNKESINIGPVWVNDMDNIAMPTIISSFDNTLVGYYDAYEMRVMIDSKSNELTPKISELSKILEKSDNPILSIIKLRDY